MENMNLNELAKQIHQNAKDKGFYDVTPNTGERFMLIVSEAAEALEAHRKGKAANTKTFFELIKKYESNGYEIYNSGIFGREFQKYVKDSAADELADVVIRILDYCAFAGIEIDNEERGGVVIPANFGEALLRITGSIYYASIGARQSEKADKYFDRHHFICDLHSALDEVFTLCQQEEINILTHIELKMKYNATRERLHGKKY